MQSTKRATDLAIEKPSRVAFLDEVPIALKLLELGITPSSRLVLVRKAPLGCPLYFYVNEQSFALRQAEAACIWVTEL